jgi:hypothetical protein
MSITCDIVILYPYLFLISNFVLVHAIQTVIGARTSIKPIGPMAPNKTTRQRTAVHVYTQHVLQRTTIRPAPPTTGPDRNETRMLYWKTHIQIIAVCTLFTQWMYVALFLFPVWLERNWYGNVVDFRWKFLIQKFKKEKWGNIFPNCLLFHISANEKLLSS